MCRWLREFRQVSEEATGSANWVVMIGRGKVGCADSEQIVNGLSFRLCLLDRNV